MLHNHRLFQTHLLNEVQTTSPEADKQFELEPLSYIYREIFQEAAKYSFRVVLNFMHIHLLNL